MALFRSGCVADAEHVWRKRHCSYCKLREMPFMAVIKTCNSCFAYKCTLLITYNIVCFRSILTDKYFANKINNSLL